MGTSWAGFRLGSSRGAVSALGVGLAALLYGGLGAVRAESGAGEAQAAFRWERLEDSAALWHEDRVIWRFHHGADRAKPYFHPMALMDGTVLTWLGPEDHPWHHGLWFSWKYINGLNYWEEDRSTGRSEGVTSWEEVSVSAREDFSARIELALAYHPPDGAVVLRERRVVELEAPSADGTYRLDWDSTFTAGDQPVRLDRTPLAHEPEGRSWGGYAGLSWRFADGLSNAVVRTHAGPVVWDEQGRFRGKDPYMEYAAVIDGRPFGVLMLDHPANLNHPTPWYPIHDDIDWLHPSPICFEAHTMPPGSELRLRYRIVVHDGHWEATRLREEQQMFVRDVTGSPAGAATDSRDGDE